MRFSRALLQTAAGLFLAFTVESSAKDGTSTPQPAKTPPSGAQAEAPQTGVPAIRSASSLVIVDVVVSDSGKPVKGLQRQAFRIFEDGREQTIKVFEEHNAADPAQIQALPPLPPNTYSDFPETTVTSAANVLLLDGMNTPMKDQVYVRQQMIEYLKNIPAGTRIAIFTLASRLRMVQGFTADRTALLAAVSDKRTGPTVSPTLPDPDEATSTKVNNSMQDAGASAQVMASLQQFQADLAAFQTDLRVQMTLDAMKQLAAYLGGIPGRKNLIWFSGSFPVSLEPDMALNDEFSAARAYSEQLRATSDLLTASRVAVYPVDARGLITAPMFNAGNANPNYSGVSHGAPSGAANVGSRGGGGARSGGGVRARNSSAGNNSNSANPNAFPGDSAKFAQTTAAEHATMQQIAEETGGQAFYDNNSSKAAVANAIENGENYYTVAYVPEDTKFDGKFRKIEVQLPEGSHQLAYRRGYYADAPSAHSSNAPVTPTTGAMQRGAPSSSQILFKVRVLPSDDPALKGLESQAGPAGLMADKLPAAVKRYWIDYAADMHQVAVSSGSDGLHHLSMEFIAIAYDRDGKILNAVNRAFKLNLQPAQFDRVMQTGLPLHQELDVPTGEVYLRIAIHDLATDRIGAMEIPLRVTTKAKP
jgi:VWFA-related protein